ncbi:MAG: hypothetical protein AMXMBFR7_26320 [Planctomycetota bacterium]
MTVERLRAELASRRVIAVPMPDSFDHLCDYLIPLWNAKVPVDSAILKLKDGKPYEFFWRSDFHPELTRLYDTFVAIPFQQTQARTNAWTPFVQALRSAYRSRR